MRFFLLIIVTALLAACSHAPQVATKAMPPAPGADRDRTALIDAFVKRLADVANSGEMFDVDATMHRLDLRYQADTIGSAPLAPNCHGDCNARRINRTTVIADTPNWYQPTQFTWLSNESTVNAALPPAFEYAVDHPPQDTTRAMLKFASLSRFACITEADVVHALPTAHQTGGSIGAPFAVKFFGTQGLTNDDFGTWLTFWFERGSPCAQEVKIEQDQKQGMRFKRAVWNHDLCVAEEQHDYCVAHGGLDVSAADLKGIDAYVNAHCPTIQAMYAKEPHTGQPPPSGRVGNWNRRNPCGF
ncbi:hypothetical protein CFB40_09400 [Burkholderia sp. AU31652]|uniref:hypothetical protein n=1 Tax=unclassified Burkholderia TaxID=2613784 RepID=UPI000B7A2B23|nr:MULTISPECIES: hypothetical protein [unclassified Burkholderia]MDN7488274.1 hypothetical protein [Burkholderia sp. AU45274]OXI90549.1 hypothetical protein CFB40_09400 [Burkholderia sp. AU31652]OXJ16808.1 hypothetical protein CFB45_09865 [Burkholderia sp. HI2500]